VIWAWTRLFLHEECGDDYEAAARVRANYKTRGFYTQLKRTWRNARRLGRKSDQTFAQRLIARLPIVAMTHPLLRKTPSRAKNLDTLALFGLSTANVYFVLPPSPFKLVTGRSLAACQGCGIRGGEQDTYSIHLVANSTGRSAPPCFTADILRKAGRFSRPALGWAILTNATPSCPGRQTDPA